MVVRTYLNLLVILFVIIVSFSPVLSVDYIEFESNLPEDYLRWTFDESQRLPFYDKSETPIRDIVSVIYPCSEVDSPGYVIEVINSNNTLRGFSRFGERIYPGFQPEDDDPVKGLILDWTIYTNKNNEQMIFGFVYINDSLNMFKLKIKKDNVEYKHLANFGSNKSEDDSFVCRILYTGDYDFDGSYEVFAAIHTKRTWRRLYCFDLENFQVEWQVSTASNIDQFQYLSCDSLDPKIMFTTANPSNGFTDMYFNDHYSYVAIVNASGEIVLSRKIGQYPHRSPRISQSNESGTLFLSHLDTMTTDGEYVIEKLDEAGAILKTTRVSGIPSNLSWFPYGNPGDSALLVIYYANYFEIFDFDLNLLAVSDTTLKPFSYEGTIILPEKTEPSYVLSHGIYDSDFNMLLSFPIAIESWQPLKLGSAMEVLDILLRSHNKAVMGSIRKRTVLGLASAFYHRNQVYILGIMSLLLIGLLSMSFLRWKTKRNLEILKLKQNALIAEEKYKQAKSIAGGFAHEIRNALFPADGLLTKLRRNNNINSMDSERVKNYYKDTHAAISRAIGITDLISNYTKLDSEYIPESTNLIKVIQDIVESNRIRITDQKVNIIYPKTDNISINVNKQQAEIVINNLLINSLDALSGNQNGIINIDTTIGEDTVLLSFKDNGKGIGSNNVNKVFDTFYSTKPETGIGIGLSMVKKIVEMYGGSISVSSEVGKGTLFQIVWKKYDPNDK